VLHREQGLLCRGSEVLHRGFHLLRYGEGLLRFTPHVGVITPDVSRFRLSAEVVFRREPCLPALDRHRQSNMMIPSALSTWKVCLPHFGQ
jgi:hypothetical protein